MKVDREQLKYLKKKSAAIVISYMLGFLSFMLLIFYIAYNYPSITEIMALIVFILIVGVIFLSVPFSIYLVGRQLYKERLDYELKKSIKDNKVTERQ